MATCPCCGAGFPDSDAPYTCPTDGYVSAPQTTAGRLAGAGLLDPADYPPRPTPPSPARWVSSAAELESAPEPAMVETEVKPRRRGK